MSALCCLLNLIRKGIKITTVLFICLLNGSTFICLLNRENIIVMF